MTDPAPHPQVVKKLMSELKDKGITDLDSLVKQITENKTATIHPRILICNNVHYCIVVKPV
jgi:hypothetical protein